MNTKFIVNRKDLLEGVKYIIEYIDSEEKDKPKPNYEIYNNILQRYISEEERGIA